MSDKMTTQSNVESELVSSFENKAFLLKLIEENSYLRKKNELRSSKKKRDRSRGISGKTLSSPQKEVDLRSDSSDENSMNQSTSDDDSSDFEILAASDGPSAKKMRKDDNIKKTDNHAFTSNIHDALKNMNDKINILSKATAQLDTAIELHREMPFASYQTAYSSDDPVPSYIGDVEYTISDEEKSVNVPVKSEDDVNKLNEILKNQDAAKKTVRK